MRSCVLADTGPLYALIDADDRYHDQAHEQHAAESRCRGGIERVGPAQAAFDAEPLRVRQQVGGQRLEMKRSAGSTIETMADHGKR